MKVSGPGPISNQSKVRGSKGSSDGSFSKFLDSASGEKEISASSTIGKINAVNFIAAVDGDEQKKRKQMMDDGEDILDELTKIRDALLFGRISIERLKIIEAKIAKIEANCDDPNLNGIIEEIKIRAAVELAKLGI